MKLSAQHSSQMWLALVIILTIACTESCGLDLSDYEPGIPATYYRRKPTSRLSERSSLRLHSTFNGNSRRNAVAHDDQKQEDQFDDKDDDEDVRVKQPDNDVSRHNEAPKRIKIAHAKNTGGKKDIDQYEVDHDAFHNKNNNGRKRFVDGVTRAKVENVVEPTVHKNRRMTSKATHVRNQTRHQSEDLFDRSASVTKQRIGFEPIKTYGSRHQNKADGFLPKLLGDDCNSAFQCSDSNAVCYRGKCSCKPKYHNKDQVCVEKTQNFTDDDKADNLPSRRVSLQGENNLMSNVSEGKLNCTKTKMLGDPCCNTRQCTTQHSECGDTAPSHNETAAGSSTIKTCTCQSGYIVGGSNACLRRQLNFVGPCSISAQCAISNSQCGQDGYCEPANGWVYADYITRNELVLQELRKHAVLAEQQNTGNKSNFSSDPTQQFFAAAWIGEECSQNNQCQAYVPKFSECRSTNDSEESAASEGVAFSNTARKVCKCKLGHIESGLTTCLEMIDTLNDPTKPCVSNLQCTQPYSTCATPANYISSSTGKKYNRVPRCICDYAYQAAFSSTNGTFCCSFQDYPNFPMGCMSLINKTIPHGSELAFAQFALAQPERAAALQAALKKQLPLQKPVIN